MVALTLISSLLAVVGAVPVPNITRAVSMLNASAAPILNTSATLFLNTSEANGSSITPLCVDEGIIPEDGIIPVSEIGCWKDTIYPEEVEDATTKLREWGSKTRIRAGSWHGESQGQAAAWVCNCKHFMKDHIVSEELDEAYAITVALCGETGSGWVWSHKWDKFFGFGTSQRMRYVGYGNDHCPSGCLWYVWEEPDHY